MAKPSRPSGQGSAGGGIHVSTGGSAYIINGSGNQVPLQSAQPVQNPIQQQQQSVKGVPVLQGGAQQLAQMDDNQLTQLYLSAMTADMPDQLRDQSGKLNDSQRFVYQAGLNGKPQVMDDAAFDAYVRQNGLQSQILSRSCNSVSYVVDGTRYNFSADELHDQTKYGRFNYVGGKHGGNCYGNGTYFDMNGGYNTGYGRVTMNAVLNPATAKVITETNYLRKASQFAASHPQFARAVGSPQITANYAIYATAMGYNVIKSGSYHNVLDRTALICKASNH